MKKTICILLALLLGGLLVLPASAAPAAPEITMQPQSPDYPEYSVAIYTVKAQGTNLTAYWYMEWQGTTYPISEIGGAMQDWEGYAGESYGARKLDDNTFAFIFEGLEAELNGAYIWCVIEDGHYDLTSQKARICVGNENTPPEILSIPVALTVEQGQEAELRCVAKSGDGSELTFCWYETDTLRLEDMRAVNRGTETTDYIFCDTSNLGTRNYLCMVQSANGGAAYSSIVPVTVTEKTAPVETQPAVAPTTEPPTEPATEPPTEPPTEPTTVPTEPTEPTEAIPETTAPAITTAPTQASEQTTAPTVPQTPVQEQEEGLSWWVFLLIGAVCGGGGAVAAFVLVKKNKH